MLDSGRFKMQILPLLPDIQIKILEIIDHIIDENHDIETVNIRLTYDGLHDKYCADCSCCGKIWDVIGFPHHLDDNMRRILISFFQDTKAFKRMIEYRRKRKFLEETAIRTNGTISSLEV